MTRAARGRVVSRLGRVGRRERSFFFFFCLGRREKEREERGESLAVYHH